MIELGLPVRLMVAVGGVRDAAATIDHRLPQQEPVADGPTAEHGRYVANMRLGCHVSDLPSAPAA
jgi:hypothetical protein